jgi:predicted lipoprotein with Yx(FWY)xxD motif
MRRQSKAETPRFLPPPEGSSLRTTSPGSPSAAAPAWLRRVLAVPAAVAMLTFALVVVTPQFSSMVSAAQVPSCGSPVTPPTGPATVSVASSAYGKVLVVGSGQYSGCSVYVLTTDRLHTLSSGHAPFACTDATSNAFKASCDTVLWPALLTDGTPVAGHGVTPGLLGTVARTDVFPGKSVEQVTYGGLPLYRIGLDDAPGQTTGEDMLDPATSPQGMWYLVDPSGGRLATGQALIGQETAPVYQAGKATGISTTVLAVSESTGLSGEVGSGGIADGPVSVPVYTFSLDKGHQSACQGMCAMYWSPVLTSMSPEAGPGVDRGQLGIIVRPDGSHQVTFDGHPLYMFHQDATLPLITAAYPTGINGAGVQAFGGLWQAVQPS